MRPETDILDSSRRGGFAAFPSIAALSRPLRIASLVRLWINNDLDKTALGTPLNLSIAEDVVIEAAAVLRGRSSGPRSAARGGGFELICAYCGISIFNSNASGLWVTEE